MSETTTKPLKSKTPRRLSKGRRVRSRWRVEVINENTLERRWSFRLTGLAARLAPLVVLAAVASLIVVILAFTPVGQILPGRLAPRERAMYSDMALRADSLEQLVGQMDRFTANIRGILTDSLPASVEVSEPVQTTDSLAGASESERRFVQQFEQRERFKLSVLTPLAADGMIFERPFTPQTGGTAVSSIYRGTVTAVQWLPESGWNVTVQHPNDFISIYSRLTDVYVTKGARVLAGQRIAAGTTPGLEMWHAGSELDPQHYIPDLNE